MATISFDMYLGGEGSRLGGSPHIRLALMGNLICSWSNNESLFICVLMIFLRTDEAAAAVLFATLITTRMRQSVLRHAA